MVSPNAGNSPRSRKRRLSAGQINFLKRREERESKEKLDAWHLNQTNPALAKAKRVKGIINNKEAWHQRRKQFPTYFAQWPNTLTAEELRLKIFVWLSHQRLQKWRGVKKHYLKTTASVRKKLTELNVYRYNFRLRVWFKCGSVEEAEATQRLADAEEAKRKSAPAGEGWFDEIIGGRLPRGELAKAEQIVLRWCKANTLAEVNTGTVEYFKRRMRQWDYLFRVDNLLMTLEKESMAEAVLVAD